MSLPPPRSNRNFLVGELPAERFVPPEQDDLFSMDEDWKKEWRGMPEFNQSDLTPFKSIALHFASLEDMQLFSKLVDQPVTLDTRSIWYPKAEIGRIANKRWVDYGHAEVWQEVPPNDPPDDHGA